MEMTLPVEISLETCKLTDEQLFQLCQDNQDLRFERSATGDLVIMPPTSTGTGRSNAGLTAQLWLWNQKTKLGEAFDSSTGFKLPNGADRSPDASWISLERWQRVSQEDRQRFARICPDFVAELMSPTDQMKRTQAKMREYLENGIRLGWLINCKTQQVEIYRPNRTVEILDNPSILSGEDVLVDFELDLSTIW